MNINLTPILQALLGLLAALITYRLIPWIKARTTNEQQAYITALIRAGVYAAEQIYKTNGMGARKMEYVKSFLRGHGFDVSQTEIEAAVSEYINRPFESLPVISIGTAETTAESNAANAEANAVETIANADAEESCVDDDGEPAADPADHPPDDDILDD